MLKLEYERTQQNLHVISVISRNDKLITTQNEFSLYQPTSLRGLMRLWYGENRSENIDKVRVTIRTAIQVCANIVEELKSYEHEIPIKATVGIMQHTRFTELIKSCITGLTNLQFTYREDAASVGQILSIIHEIEDFLRAVEPHSESLKSRISSNP